MSKIYLPYASQFDLMNENLAKIANAISSDIDLSTWAGIQKAVRVGVAPDLLPVGTQLVVSHSVYGEKLYDVVAHNYLKSAHDENAHTMTLMSHDNLAQVQFDAPEAFYCPDDYVTSGDYNFTIPTTYSSWVAGTYKFTLGSDHPGGARFCLSGSANTAITSLKVNVFDDPNSTTPTESVAITGGSDYDGTNLGTFGVELNHVHRVSDGSNNYRESAIRQFLNSSSTAGNVWKPQTKFDRPPSWKDTLAGFAGGFDDEFLSVVGEVVVPCAANNTYELPTSTTVKGAKYTVTDKFYLASQREIFGTASDVVDDGSTQFPYYEGAMNPDRIKYRDGAAAVWWSRSANAWYSNNVRTVHSDGSLFSGEVRVSFGFAPVCTIV